MLKSRVRFQSTVRRAYLSLSALLFLAACSGLAGEPQIVATLPSRPEVVDVGLPSAPPDIVQGAQIYAENCIRCHGPGGQGNGELVLNGQIPTPPRDFTDPATTRDQALTEWFATITNGRLENLMPPWGNSLSESERWAVALYTYTLNYLPDQLDDGQTLWN
ncbi:MAG: c-type cytochrome, partial [Candidatus Methanoperedens sp.]|nr:c-type cytochrome [Candidatus Methanoperedens sp.]